MKDLFAYAIFVDVIRASLNGDTKTLQILKTFANEIIEKFRPDDKDLLNVPIEKADLQPGIAGMYDHHRDVVMISSKAKMPTSEILNHELTHRNIFRKCTGVSQKFIFNILLELVDNDIEDWLEYYVPVYIIKQLDKIKKIYKI
jgi:hypothetical protein